MTDTDNLLEVKKTSKKPSKKNKRRKKKRVGGIIVTILIIMVIAGCGSALYFMGLLDKYLFPEAQIPVEEIQTFEELVEEIPEESLDNSKIGSEVTGHLVKAGLEVLEAYNLRPPTVELTDENRGDFVKISDCKIEEGKVMLSMESEGIPKSDDKYYYLFEIKGYDDSNTLYGDVLNKVYKDDTAAFGCSLNAGGPNTRLYSKFGVAVLVDGEYRLVSVPKYITNPEAIAPHAGFVEAGSKKGILIDYNKVHSGQLEDLGVKQAAMNFPLASILGPTTNAAFPSVHYSYNGKTYTFNGTTLAGFDQTVASLTSRGIQVTAILLNNYSYGYQEIIHPDARKPGVCPYYMFNGSDQAGCEILAAVGSFLADRYSGSKHGRISNWIIANEINARKEWNYLNYTDVDTYSREYAKGFRVLYTAIKSTSSNARVYISLDQTWDRNLSNSGDYDGKDVLTSFAGYLNRHGNIDWSLAYHPYNIPLTSCKTWASSKYVNHTSSTPMMSMQNIDVLVNYMNQSSMLNPAGNCRSILISELGYTSTAGESLQAAAIAYAFYKINNYKDIDGLLLNRQTDDATEIAQGLATGITGAGGRAKASYTVFKYMDTSQWETYLEPYKSVIGISSWSQIMY